MKRNTKTVSNYLSTIPTFLAGKSARSRSSLDHADMLKGDFDPCQKQKQNENGPGCKNGPGCRYSSMPTTKQKHADIFSSTKEMSINPHQGLLNRVIILPQCEKKT